MKKIFLLTALAVSVYAAQFTLDNPANKSEEKVLQEQERERLCKLFTQKALDYKATMRDDRYAKLTLKSYQSRADIYCMKEGD